MRQSTTLVALVATLSLGATACVGVQAGGEATPAGAQTATAADGPRVVVTTTVLGDIVRQLVESDGQVEVLMPPGQDPHGFSPSARQAASLREADLVVANGLQLEESLLDTIQAAEQEGIEVLRVAEELDPIAFDSEDDHEDEGHSEDDHEDEGHSEDDHGDEEADHAHAEGDPHVWFDPVRMADGAVLIAGHLARVDDTRSDDEWRDRGRVVADAILAVHDEVETILGAVPDECRQLVTNHDAFGYFAARYDFEIVGTVVPGTSSQADASAQGFAELAETLRTNRVPAIFAETTQSTRLAESLAGEIGREIEIVTLHTGSLGEPGSGAETYAGLLTTNARRVADALAAC